MFTSLGRPLVRHIPLDQIDLPSRPWRLKADAPEMAALAESIRRLGLLTPILVRPKGGRYELVAGCRRYWCAKRLGWKKIPAVVRGLTDAEAIEAALAENALRLDLSAAEKAEAFHQTAALGLPWTPGQLAKCLGETPAFAGSAEAIRNLPLILREALILRIVTPDEACVLAALGDDRRIVEAIRAAREEGAGTKGLREIVARLSEAADPQSSQSEVPSPQSPVESPPSEGSGDARPFDSARLPPGHAQGKPETGDVGLGTGDHGVDVSVEAVAKAEGVGAVTDAERAALAAIEDPGPPSPVESPPSEGSGDAEPFDSARLPPGHAQGKPETGDVGPGTGDPGADLSAEAVAKAEGADQEPDEGADVKSLDLAAQPDPVKAVRRLFQGLQKQSALDLELLKAVVVRLMRDLAQLNPVDYLDLTYRESPRRYLPRHALNVAKLALYVGKHYGFTEDDLIVLGTSALLCDVGMLKIEEGILYKAERLDAREWQRVRSHALEGSVLLGRPKALWDTVARVAGEHHERVNGGGYPRGLKGTALHTYSKLVAICDTYEALTGSRAHKTPVLPREAMERVQHEAETGLLDKPLAAAFARSLGAFPIGSFVQLAPGEVAQVIWANATEPAKPMVRVVVDRQGRPQVPPPIVDLTKDESAHPIKAVWPPKIG